MRPQLHQWGAAHCTGTAEADLLRGAAREGTPGGPGGKHPPQHDRAAAAAGADRRAGHDPHPADSRRRSRQDHRCAPGSRSGQPYSIGAIQPALCIFSIFHEVKGQKEVPRLRLNPIQTHDEGNNRITAVRQAAVQLCCLFWSLSGMTEVCCAISSVPTAVNRGAPRPVQGQAMTELWPGTDLPTAEEARQEWERRIAQSPTIPTGTAPTVSPGLS